MPPLQEVLDALRLAVLPALLVALFVFWLLARLAPKRGVAIGCALGLAAGFLAGNHFREALTFPFDELRHGLLGTLTRADDPSLPSAWDWLPWLAGLGLLVGLVTSARLLPRLLARVGFFVVAGVTTRLLVPGEMLGVELGFVATVTLSWIVLDLVARRYPGAWLPVGLSFVYLMASLVLLHAHSARLADVALILSASLFGIAVVAWWRKASVEGIIPGVAITLPGLLLIGQQNTFSEVPLAAFLLPGLSLLPLGVLLLPGLTRQKGRWPILVGLALFLLPAIVAVILAARAESIAGG